MTLPEAQSTPDLEQLQRRLDRATAARREAEAIAEKGLRDLWERQRAASLLESIADTANRSNSSRQAFQRALKQICAFTGWPVGHVYLTERRGARRWMIPTRIWAGAQGRALARFRKMTESLAFEPGFGLPGRVLASGKPCWLPHLEDDPLFPRGPIAAKVGLKTGLGFPVVVRDEVVAVLEFFTPEFQEPDSDLLEVMRQAGAQLGRTFEREQADKRLRAKNRRLRLLVRRAEEARSAAEAASSAKSAFLAVTSHEIRTPLNAVLGLAEALRREPLTPHQTALTQGVVDSGAMLMRLLNAVLDLSRIEAGQVSLEAQPFSLRATLATIARVWGSKAEELGVDLALELGELAELDWVCADAGKIEQCAVNLISNAMKFTPRGGGVRVSAAEVGTGRQLAVRLTVDDQGPGVPPADRARIFEPYVQTDSGREAGGAGLGLSICAGHAMLLGGALEVSDAPSGGARFTLTVPVESAASPALAEPETAESTRTAGAPLRLLVAEDNAANRRVIEVLLQPLEVTLTFALNGREAVEAVQTQTFDLVLMDANMPVMNGVEAVRAIRRLPSKASSLPIHMVTANVFEDDIRAYHAAGADGVLAKPIQVQALYALLAGSVSDEVDASHVA